MRALGLDVGGTKLLGCLIDERGAIIGRAVRPTGRAASPLALLRLCAEIASEISAFHGPFDAAGLGFPGLVDAPRGLVRSSVMLDGWRDVPLAQRLTEALRVPVAIDNDVNAAALAELLVRASAPQGFTLFVAVGTGIGGALALDGRVLRGASGVAGEIGNTTIRDDGPACWCGRRGCLNTLASGAAIERMLEIAPGTLIDVPASDPRLPGVARRAAQALGEGLADAVNLLNPALVVLGGGVTRIEGYFEEAVSTARRAAFAEASERCAFERARAGYEAGAIGAGLLGFEALRSLR